MSITSEDRAYFESLIQRMIAMGSTPIALYGAGRTARSLSPMMRSPGDVIAGIIDDDPAKNGRVWAGLPVIDFDTALTKGVKGAILTAVGAMQDALWAKRRRFRQHDIYLLSCPQRFENKEWDELLIDHYEYTVAQSRGLQPAYIHGYPAPEAEAQARLLEPLRQLVKPGAVIAEIGAGAGLYTEHVIDTAGTYHIVDFSRRLLHEVIEHRFARRQDKLHLHHDESARLHNVPDTSVDVLFSFDVFVHFKSDLVHQFLDSIKRVLRPQGTALLHFAAWNASAIEEWRSHHVPEQGGRHTSIYYNHIDWLRESSQSMGLSVEQIGSEWNSRFLARFSHG